MSLATLPPNAQLKNSWALGHEDTFPGHRCAAWPIAGSIVLSQSVASRPTPLLAPRGSLSSQTSQRQELSAGCCPSPLSAPRANRQPDFTAAVRSPPPLSAQDLLFHSAQDLPPSAQDLPHIVPRIYPSTVPRIYPSTHYSAVAESVFKFPRSTMIKITFKDGDMARKAIMEGIHLFQIHVQGHQMRQEIYTPLLTCNRDCKASTKKSLNCRGEHSARAMQCPTCKEALKRKEAAAQQAQARQSNTTYTQIAQATPSPTGLTTPDPSKTLAGLMCLFHAHLANASSLGCFQQTLSASLAENGLPDVKLSATFPSPRGDH
ncbi:hypothetical protein O3P69_007992 [Scylla paramamosain]|uniref:Uncharacterized protein n=1 Tax=Scylla paramamosain TaxID=85552 RepID=A0AAW0T193_SCYPA